jgi:hypothetical protein
MKMEVKAEQEVQWVIGGLQASICEDTNIVMIKASPGASNHLPLVWFIFISCLSFLDVH